LNPILQHDPLRHWDIGALKDPILVALRQWVAAADLSRQDGTVAQQPRRYHERRQWYEFRVPTGNVAHDASVDAIVYFLHCAGGALETVPINVRAVD
jgi:hypothetical protein